MADGRPPAPQPPPVIPPVAPPAPPLQPPAPPAQLIIPPTQPIQPAPMSHLNWSHFKPEFTGKPDETVEAHLLRTNVWMDTHAFPEDVKVQHFHLTLIGEAKLWYESLRPMNSDWNGLKISICSNILTYAILRKSYFMNGNHFILMKIQKH